MSEFEPYITADGSVGLYNKEFEDIYHSATGAVTESLEKFVLPIDYEILLKQDEIKILDVCYGIGYNTKTFLNFLSQNQKKFLEIKLKNNSKHEYYSDTIHTDNIKSLNTSNNIEPIHTDKNICNNLHENSNKYTETTYSDKIFNKITINAVDNDKILPFLSPLLKTYQNFSKINKNIPEKYREKYLKSKKHKKIKNFNEINYQLLSRIISQNTDYMPITDILNIISSNKKYFSRSLTDVFRRLNYRGIDKHPFIRLYSNLHNIYYRYISYSYKRTLNNLKIGDIMFNLYIDDARNYIKNDKNSYNLIFLDAFSPKKCPCLWTYEFFKELYRILSDDGMLLTYSTSANIRSAMKEAGFCIGNNLNTENKIIGTIAVKNSSLIKHPLSETDLGLLKTKAGIFYRDENLTGENEAIINAHNLEVENSNRISTTSYLKQVKEAQCMTL